MLPSFTIFPMLQNEHEVAPNTARGRMWPMQYLPPIKKASEIVSTLIATNEKIAGEEVGPAREISVVFYINHYDDLIHRQVTRFSLWWLVI